MARAFESLVRAVNPLETVCSKHQESLLKDLGGYRLCPRSVKVQAVLSSPSPSVVETSSKLQLSTTTAPTVTREVLIKDDPVTEDVHAFWDYQRLFQSQRAEVSTPVQLKVVEGAIPADLNGSYYLCGPGITTDDHGSSVSPLDGHGYLRKFSFQNQTAQYSARYVKTEAMRNEFDPESGAWKFTYRGPFSLLRHGHRIGNFKVMKNVANTSVLKWGGKLLCLWEGGEPYEINEETLETVGPFKLPIGKGVNQTVQTRGNSSMSDLRERALELCTKAILPILTGAFHMPEERVLAHFKIDEKRQRLVVLTSRAEDMVLPKATFTAYEFDASFKLVHRRVFVLHEQLMTHDWALTDEHYIIFGNRVKLNTSSSMAAMAGLTPMINCLEIDETAPSSPMYILPRFNVRDERDWRVPARFPGQLWLTHVANAYEQTVDYGQRTRVVLKACVSSYKWFSLSTLFGYKWQEALLDTAGMNTPRPPSAVGRLHSPRMVRLSVEVDNVEQTVRDSKVERFVNAEFSTDFPVVNSGMSGGRRNRFTYVNSNSRRRKTLSTFPADSISKLHGVSGKVCSWWAGERSFVGEPQFVPRGIGELEEDDGYIVFVEYSVARDRRYLVVLDAKRIGSRDALVVKLEVPRNFNFPFGFHGFWQDMSQKY